MNEGKMQVVIDRVKKEYAAFKEAQLQRTPKEVFENHYEIHVKTELYEVITEGDEYMNCADFEGLYDLGDGVLDQLYDEFLSFEFASVNTYGETAEFIKNAVEFWKDC